MTTNVEADPAGLPVRRPPRVLVVGGGGREHAIVHALARSPRVPELWCVPGNPGISQLATCIDVPLGDVDGVVRWASHNDIDLVVVGPEGPLVAGLADACTASGVSVFGPTRAAARIEGSKSFAKEVMAAAGVPTAASETFDAVHPALEHVRASGGRVVVKADGLAAGKGVVVAESIEHAEAAVVAMLSESAFGDAGSRIVVEERLEGPEVSLLALVSGTQVRALVPARDHKRALDGDLGPNTGGMGAFAPVADVDSALVERIEREVLSPVAAELVRRGTPYRGVLYAGLMLTADGPRVIEFNARFGDPEAQVVLPLLKSDLLSLLEAVVDGTLDDLDIKWHDGAAATIVVAAPGYPAAPRTGQPVTSLPRDEPDVTVYHGGTIDVDGELQVCGGRVFAVTARGSDLADARSRAYSAASEITFDGAWSRSDIGAPTTGVALAGRGLGSST